MTRWCSSRARSSRPRRGSTSSPTTSDARAPAPLRLGELKLPENEPAPRSCRAR
jgi:hypothetical protein